MIRFINVSKHFLPGRGIEGISFTIERGDFVLLAGPTGVGKTTILRLIYLELYPDSGQIVIEGQPVRNHQARALALMRRKMGIVFPEPRLLPDRTIFDNVALPLRIAGEHHRRTQLQVNRLLFRFDLQDRSRARPHELSSGEQKKAAIARALVARPFVLLADEPLANIDLDASTEILDHLYQINSEGTTILAVTHIPEPYEGIAKRIIHMSNGRLLM